MRFKVMATEAVAARESVKLTILRLDKVESADVVLPAWLVDYLGVMAGDVLSVCREYEDASEGRRGQMRLAKAVMR